MIDIVIYVPYGLAIIEIKFFLASFVPSVLNSLKPSDIYIYIYNVSKLSIIGSDNGLLPGRHQAIIWADAGILLIGPIGTNFNEILIEIY